jgi:hypothetical protein
MWLIFGALHDMASIVEFLWSSGWLARWLRFEILRAGIIKSALENPEL